MDVHRERVQVSARFVTSIQFKPPAAGVAEVRHPGGCKPSVHSTEGPDVTPPI
ncbi:hypothetical protein I553_6877 [Mycobacterium xenopi 4042]|uniref:Uncharacterized protein n=1 Tax=Mycobacterium xenopi 4042 TaxID=1299334 RepID=X7Z4R3_MYCXE|nr:hypothetical protein I553_6877 [Mycobacterium xenopi 4042]